MNPKVSIIIPCRTISEAEECIYGCLKQAHGNIEIIVLPDLEYTGEPFKDKRVIISHSGIVLPSYKRDLGIKETTGEVIAFIDADAVPFYFWLSNALVILAELDLGGICGPGILPPESSPRKRAADCILKILPFSYRVVPKMPRYVDDYPTFNLIMWRKDIIKVGGFNCDYLTGEDSHLCEKIIALGKKIYYSPSVCVFHDRRELFRPFFKQIATYGRHRGYFFKNGIGSSRKCIYLLPIGFCIVVILLLTSFILHSIVF